MADALPSDDERSGGPSGRAVLSNRQCRVLRLLDQGMTNAEIGEALQLSPNTVKAHLRAAAHKLDVGSRADLARRAAELGLLEPHQPPSAR